MISFIYPSDPGVTYGIWTIIKTMQDNPNELLAVFKINKPGKPEEFCWAALFREKNTIGQFVAMINHWGTNFGKGSGGTGSAGFCEMMSFVEDNDIKVIETEWSHLSDKEQKILTASNSISDCNQIWEPIINYALFSILPSTSNYPMNEQWKTARDSLFGR